MTEMPDKTKDLLERLAPFITTSGEVLRTIVFSEEAVGVATEALLAAEKRGEERERERCVERAMRKTKELDIRSDFDRGYRAGRMAAATDIRLMTAAIRKGSD